MKDKLKKFIRENWGGLVAIFLVIILFYIPINYDIDCDGGLINLYNRIEVSPSYKMKGSINITYVGGLRGTVATVLLSKVIPSWDAHKIEEILLDNETYEEQLRRGKISLREAEQNSIYVALTAAGYDVKIKSYEVTLYYKDSKAITTLEAGDVIVSIDEKKVSNMDDLTKIIESHESGDELNIKVKRKNKDAEATATIREEEGRKIIGIYLNPIIELEYPENISIEFNKENNEYGSSGGLMNTLLIYNKITEEDITKGDTISGTGSINIDGTVQKIAGIKYKLRGAYKAGATVFIAPTENYEEAIKIKEKYHMDIEIIEAKTFNQVVEELKKRN